MPYISRICAKVSNQVFVLSRFKNLVLMDTRCKLKKAFICSYFRYCSSVWYFCRASDREKLELLNKRALRAVYNDQASIYEQLLERVGQCSLNDMRIQDHLLLTFKVIHGFNLPKYLTDMIRLRPFVKNLCGS